MKVIRDLSESIENLIGYAEDNIDLAIEWKEEFPEVAKAYASLSEALMSGVSSLHTVVAKVITDYRRENGEPPSPMMAVYDYLHKKHIDNSARVKAMQAMYKES